MFFIYLILLVWIGYAAIMIVVEFIEDSMHQAANALNERDKRKRDAARAEKGEQ
jgi:hypothetical protein